jgi:putative endonuclease
MPVEKAYSVYILTNYTNRVLYTGVTNDLLRRVQEHRDGTHDGFTKKYKVWKLVHFEPTNDIQSAIEREKQLKAGSRAAKVALIELTNPRWRDLFQELNGGARSVKGCFGLATAMASQ